MVASSLKQNELFHRHNSFASSAPVRWAPLTPVLLSPNLIMTTCSIMVLRRQSQRPTEARSIILFFIAAPDPDPKRSIYIIIIVCIVDFYHCSWICYIPDLEPAL